MRKKDELWKNFTFPFMTSQSTISTGSKDSAVKIPHKYGSKYFSDPPPPLPTDPEIFPSSFTHIKKSMIRYVAIENPQKFKLAYVLTGPENGYKHRIVFVCGMNASMFNFDNQFAYFSKQPDFQCLFVDNRGIGNSDNPGGRWTTSIFASDIIKVCDSLGWKDNIIFCGGSMGGMIIQHIALTIPKRIKSIIVFATHSGSWIKPITPLSTRLLFARSFVQSTVDYILWSILDPLFSQEYLHSPSPVEPYKTMREYLWTIKMAASKLVNPQEVLSAINHVAASQTHYLSSSQLDTIKSLKIPKLVMVSEKDNVILPQRTKELAKQIQAELYSFSNSGHCPTTEKYDEFNKVVHYFIINGTMKDFFASISSSEKH